LVLIYADGTFNSLNDKRSKHVHIYIDAPEFKGFTSENIKQLRDAEIETASLIFGNPDGSYREVTSPLALDMLPIQAQAQTQTVQTSSTPTSTSTTTTDNTTGIIFAVVLAIVIIVLLFVLYRAYGPVNALY
jgi:hypothetical protein